jgi:pSer/pThr/pTyr-binding forkhead associated (FHA) protein
VLRTSRPAREAPSLEIDGQRYPLASPVTVVGRGSDADIRLDDPGVSRRHVQVQPLGRLVRVVDLGSTNGTLVDGRRVTAADLRDGDSFVLGRTSVTVRIGSSAGVDTASSMLPGLR